MVFDESKDPQKHVRPPRPEHAKRDLAVRPTREDGPMGRRRLEGDVRAGMAKADDQHGPVGELRRFRYSPEWICRMPASSCPAISGTAGTVKAPVATITLARPEAAVSRDGDELVATVAGRHQAFHRVAVLTGSSSEAA